MFPNLLAEKARNKLTNMHFADALGISEGSVKNKLAGHTEFTRKEMLTLRDQFFPGLTLEYLFEIEMR